MEWRGHRAALSLQDSSLLAYEALFLNVVYAVHRIIVDYSSMVNEKILNGSLPQV